MRKHVYGKKTAQSAFTVSNIFSESSPAKTASRPATREEKTANDILVAADALQSLQIQDEDSSSSRIQPRRRALSRRDGKLRPNSKHGIQDGEKECTKTKTVKQTAQKPTGRRRSRSDVVSEDEKVTDLSSMDQISNDELCDPYVRPLLALTNEQKLPLQFEEWSDNLIPHFTISKIAEASYSEVYRLSLLDEHPTLTTADESVLKLIAIKPPHSLDMKKSKARQRREENMSSMEDIESEVRLLKRMTEIPGFTNYRAVHILQGRPSKPFVQAWKEWNKARRKGEKSEFPDPSRKANYEENQYWAVIEMQDAGTDVERLLEEKSKTNAPREPDDGFSITSIWSTWDIFWQMVLAVAKGESEARFEHRDLHLGNICVRRKNDMQHITLADDPWKLKLGFTNLELTIIDYTLSRADMSNTLKSRPQSSHSSSSQSTLVSIFSKASGQADIAYNPLHKQPRIFEGDAEDDYQYEIYRHMRSIVEASAIGSEEIWEPYQPKTNLLWLHFVLFKLSESLLWPSEQTKKSKDRTQRKALELEDILTQVEDLLNVDRLLGQAECLISSAAELVAIALEQGWLDQDDINS
jgi:serine/threonine-protein kinase haspin